MLQQERLPHHMRWRNISTARRISSICWCKKSVRFSATMKPLWIRKVKNSVFLVFFKPVTSHSIQWTGWCSLNHSFSPERRWSKFCCHQSRSCGTSQVLVLASVTNGIFTKKHYLVCFNIRGISSPTLHRELALPRQCSRAAPLLHTPMSPAIKICYQNIDQNPCLRPKSKQWNN